MDLNAPVKLIKGVGDKIEKLLNKLNIFTVLDLLCYLPKDYKDFSTTKALSSVNDGEEAAVSVVVEKEPKLNRIRRNLSILKFSAIDETGRLNITYFNQPYLKEHIQKGDELLLLGRVQKDKFGMHMDNPLIHKGDDRQIHPVYSLTAGLTQKKLRQITAQALKASLSSVTEIFPADFRNKHHFCEVNYAFENIHFPKDNSAKEMAKRRLVFEEMLLFSAMLDMLGGGEREDSNFTIEYSEDMIEKFMRLLSFKPTGAQRKVMMEILNDYKSKKAQNRLIQGDVGSGKTALAFFAMYVCVKSGYQCAMMAPTELLARQHFENAFRLFMDEGINIELITGSHTASKKQQTVKKFTSGQADILFGTHALIYENVDFFNLGLVVTDEQHRFGVRQRAKLQSKGSLPNMIIMSATPIPRTMALLLYGKTDISVVDEMPPGRKTVKTHVVPEEKRKSMYEYIKNETINGGQAFVVCPLIEKNEDVNARSAQEIYDELKKIFLTGEIALLHGKMKPSEKDEIMRSFQKGKISLLVSTTVIEVGVDIPNATVMVVENAERFGLAQLHQLRGRVGRGEKPSYCFLTTSGADTAKERLEILTHSNDGFYIAQKDLLLRGPGEFLGSRQNGVGDLYMASLIKDVSLIEEAHNIYEELKQNDQTLLQAVKDAARLTKIRTSGLKKSL